MKKIIISVFMLLVMASVSMGAVVGVNLLKNPDFVDVGGSGSFPEYWNRDDVLFPHFNYSGGILSFSRVEADRGVYEEMYQGDAASPIELVPGGIYEVGFDAELTDVNNNWGEFSITVKIECFDNPNYDPNSNTCCMSNYVNVLPGYIKPYVLPSMSLSTSAGSPAQIRGKFQAPICNHKYARFYIYIDKGIYATKITFKDSFLKYAGNKALVASFNDNVFSNNYVRNVDANFNVTAAVDTESQAFPSGTSASDIKCSFILYPTMRPFDKYISPTVPSDPSISANADITPVANGKFLYFNLQSKTDFIKDLAPGAYTLKVVCHKSGDIKTVYGEDTLYLNIVNSLPGGYGYALNVEPAHTGKYVFNINGNPVFLMGVVDKGNPDVSLSEKDLVGSVIADGNIYDYLCRIKDPVSDTKPFNYEALAGAGINFVSPENLYAISMASQLDAINRCKEINLNVLYPFQDFYSDKMNPELYPLSGKELIQDELVASLSGQTNIIGWYTNGNVNNINLEDTVYSKRIISKIDSSRPFFNGFNIVPNGIINTVSHFNEYNDVNKAGDVLIMDMKPNDDFFKWTTAEMEGINNSFDAIKIQEVSANGTKFIISKIALDRRFDGEMLTASDLSKLIKLSKTAGADGILFDHLGKIIEPDPLKAAMALSEFMMAVGDKAGYLADSGIGSSSGLEFTITTGDLQDDLTDSLNEKADGTLVASAYCDITLPTANSLTIKNVTGFTYNVTCSVYKAGSVEEFPLTILAGDEGTVNFNTSTAFSVKVVAVK